MMPAHVGALSGIDRGKCLPTYFEKLAQSPTWRWSGRVVDASAQTIESLGPPSFVGECCDILGSDGVSHRGEVIGFHGRNILVMPLDSTNGIQYGDRVMAVGKASTFPVGPDMQGRIFDALGLPIDGKGQLKSAQVQPVDGSAPRPLERSTIREPLSTGVCVGGAVFAKNEVPIFLHAAGSIFSGGLQLAAPVMAAALAVEVALALIGRLSPQLPAMALSIPIKTSVSYLVLIASLSFWPGWIETHFTRMLHSAALLVASG